MWPTRGAKMDTKPGHRGHRATDATGTKSLFQNRVTKGETLMFVRRDNIGDERKAIFVRITNIAISCSANNETVRVIKKQMSTQSSRASTPSMPSTPKRSRVSAKKKMQTRNYISMLQRHRKSSFATMLDEYSRLDDSSAKESQKRSMSLEDEVRQIDAFFNNLTSKKGGTAGKAKVHVMEEDFDIARLWKDLGYTVVKSKNRPSIFEVASPSSAFKPDKGLRDMRKSLQYIPRGDDSSSVASDTISRGPSETSQHASSASISHRIAESLSRATVTEKPSKPAIVLSPQNEAKPDDKAHMSRIRRYYEKFKGFFSLGKEPQSSRQGSPQALDRKNTRFGSDDSIEPSRRVKWSDSPTSLATVVEEREKRV